MDAASTIFERERGRLMALAYGFLGSHTEAEDIVQEAWLRYASAVHELQQPEAWLTTVVSRIALDHLRSAKRRRETYPGIWLPEPVATLPDPEAAESERSLLSIAFLHLLETLSPEERAIVVLREGFERSYEEIASIIGKSEQACRQMFSRARRRLHEKRASGFVRVPKRIVQQCMDAFANGDEQALLSLLAGDAVLYGDGGGRVPSVLNPIFGADRIGRFFSGLLRKYQGSYQVRLIETNNEPALLTFVEGRPAVLAFSFDGNRIIAFHSISNPEKLSSIIRTYAAA